VLEPSCTCGQFPWFPARSGVRMARAAGDRMHNQNEEGVVSKPTTPSRMTQLVTWANQLAIIR